MYAFHGIFSAYGFWLPNDPRGSWSDWIGSWELLRYGPATKVDTRHSIAQRPHDHALRQRAKEALKFPPVCFDGLQARAIAQGIADAAAASGYRLHALAVLPDHVHVVVGATERHPSQVIGHLKAFATRRLIAEGIHPFATDEVPVQRSCWADQAWKVYLDEHEDVERAIRYVEANPEKEGKRRQPWKNLVPYDPATAVSRRACPGASGGRKRRDKPGG